MVVVANHPIPLFVSAFFRIACAGAGPLGEGAVAAPGPAGASGKGGAEPLTCAGWSGNMAGSRWFSGQCPSSAAAAATQHAITSRAATAANAAVLIASAVDCVLRRCA